MSDGSCFSKALVVDRVGELPTHLIDALLAQGFWVYYWGKEDQKNFYYLAGKTNFFYLNSLAEVQPLNNLDYVFCFPEENFSDLETIITLVEEKGIKIIFSFAKDFLEKEKYFDLITNRKFNGRIIVFDNLFGPRITRSFLGKVFKQAAVKNEIVVNDCPAKALCPVSADFLIKETIRLLFSPETKGRRFFLRTPTISLEKFLDLVLANFSGKKAVFKKDKLEENEKNLYCEEILADEPLVEKIEETAQWFLRNIPKEGWGEETVWPVSRPVEILRTPPEKDRLTFLFQQRKLLSQKTKSGTSCLKKIVFGLSLFFFFFFIFFFLPLGLSLGLGYLGLRETNISLELVKQGNFSSALAKNQNAGKRFSQAQKIILTSSPFYNLIGLTRPIDTLGEIYLFSQKLSETLKFLLVAGEEGLALAENFVNGSTVSWPDKLEKIKVNFSFAYDQASLAQLSLDKAEPGFRFFHQTALYQELKEHLPEARLLLLKTQKVISVLPEILAVGSRKTYFVLLQNNMELRPTGGFLGSYGLVHLENGRLVDFEVYDVYQADGQMKGHVEPPAKLKDYLGESAWYLRDSNWDPDFPVSARRAQWFLDKEMQIATDGVAALTLEVARKIIRVFGEVAVLEFAEKITENNLFQKAEYYSELGTFPGSTQKKDFLGSLAKAVFARIRTAKKQEMLLLGQALYTSLEEREAQLYFNHEDTEAVASSLLWGGHLRDFRPTTESKAVLFDYLNLNEANVGINKANFFVKRAIHQEISLKTDGVVENKLTLIYENQSPSESWPAGRYKAYLRVYLPGGTKIKSVLIGDNGLWLPYDTRLSDQKEENGKSVFGLVIEVPIKTQKKYEIAYELPEKFNFASRVGSYLLLAQKQSGAYASPYSLIFKYPGGVAPLRVLPSAVVGENQLLISQTFTKDMVFQIDLAK